MKKTAAFLVFTMAIIFAGYSFVLLILAIKSHIHPVSPVSQYTLHHNLVTSLALTLLLFNHVNNYK
jgi:hypothetical protein